MMVRQLKYLCLSGIFLSSCSLIDVVRETNPKTLNLEGRETFSIYDLQSKDLANIQPPLVKPVVAVYPTAFTDQTGQRKSNSEFAMFSSAITQAPNTILIRSLKHASGGNFFRVVERVGLDNLTKERQLIRSTREQLDDQSILSPLLFAGVLLEGAIVTGKQIST